MKKQKVVFVIAALSIALVTTSCSKQETLASKSQSAYLEAKEKGLAPDGGAAHGGHTATSADQPMDHSKMSSGNMAGMDHSKMSGESMAGMDHSKMSGGDMAGMDHSKMSAGNMAGMDHAKMSGGNMAGMDHAKMSGGNTAGMDHSKMGGGNMAGMDHSKMSGGNMAGMDHSNMGSAIPEGGLWGRVPGAVSTGTDDRAATAPLQQMTVTLGTAPAPRSSREMSQLEPAMTLRQDGVDVPAPISVRESAKDAAGDSHEGPGVSGTTIQEPGEVDPHAAHRATPAPKPAAAVATDPHAAHKAPSAAVSKPKAKRPARAVAPSKPPTPKVKQAPKPAATIYVCPMHPEVTSTKPGSSCPKCGMALVKKEKK